MVNNCCAGFSWAKAVCLSPCFWVKSKGWFPIPFNNHVNQTPLGPIEIDLHFMLGRFHDSDGLLHPELVNSVAQSRPFDLLVSPVWSMFVMAPKGDHLLFPHPEGLHE